MHIHFFTPFSITKDFLSEIDYYMSLLKLPTDWACIMDGDALFLRPDFGNCILEYINRYPETGMFTSYASRCHYRVQVPEGVDMENDSILFHKKTADRLNSEFQATQEVIEINQRIAGHLMLIKKGTWNTLRKDIFARCRVRNKKILGVDTQISYSVLYAGMDIKLMKGIYLLHYLRMAEGILNDKHLK